MGEGELVKIYRGSTTRKIDVLPSVLALGTFDGLHRGHQSLLAETKRLADLYQVEPTVVCFRPHPRVVLTGKKIPKLAKWSDFCRLLEAQGITQLVVFRFDIPFSKVSAHSFFEEYLLKQCQARAIVVGEDYRFGAGREGTVATLQHWMPNKVQVCALYQEAGQRISSSACRDAVRVGDWRSVSAYLGRPYQLWVRVGPGQSLYALGDILLPQAGEYWVWHHAQRVRLTIDVSGGLQWSHTRYPEGTKCLLLFKA